MADKLNSTFGEVDLQKPAFWNHLKDACFLLSPELIILAANKAAWDFLESYVPVDSHLTDFFKPVDSYEYFEFTRKLEKGHNIKDEAELYFDNGKIKLTFFNRDDGNFFVVLKRLDWHEHITATAGAQTLTVPQLVILSSADGAISSSNLQFNKVFEIKGRSAGKNFFEILQKKGANLLSDNLHDYCEGFFDTSLVKKNGQDCWLRWKVKKDSFAGKTFFRITGVDVTEEISAKNELQLSNQRFQDIANVQGQFIWETDDNFIIRFISAAIQEISGYKPNELIGRSILDFFEENQQSRIHTLLKKNGIKPGTNLFTAFQHRIIDKNGESVWLSSSGHKIEGKNNEFLGLRGISVDVSRQKTKFAKLAQREHRYELLFRQTPIGVFYYDDNLKVIESNETFLDIIGYSVHQIVGTDLRMINDKRILPAILASIDGDNGEYEGVYSTANKSTIYIKLKCVPFYGSDNEVTGGIGLMEDISKARRAREALEFQIDLESLALDISSRLINIEDKSIEGKINDALKRLGRFTQSDRSYLLITDKNLEKFDKINIWCSAGTESDEEHLKQNTIADFPVLNNCIKENKSISVTDVSSELKIKNAEKEHLRQFDVKSFLLIPFATGNGTCGLIGFDHCKTQKRWKNSEVIVLQQVAHSFASLLQRQTIELKLRQSEERFRSLVYNASDLITIFGSTGRLFYNTPSFERILGYSLDKRRRYSFNELVHPEDLFMVLRSYAFSKAHPGKVVKVEFRMKCSDDSYAYFESLLTNEMHNPAIKAFVASSRDITERVESEKKIKESLAQNKLLLGEIHHRVKNNLAVVTGLLGLQAESLKSKEAKSVFIESEMRIRSMAMIHQKLYQADTYSRVEFSGYIQDLIKTIGASYDTNKNIRILLNMDNLYLSLDKATPCGLIINELLTNAYKHAFKNIENPEISVTMTKSKNLVSLNFSDNGVGLPDGINFDETDSLGTQLITGLSQQLAGEFSYKSENGTTFILKFEDA